MKGLRTAAAHDGQSYHQYIQHSYSASRFATYCKALDVRCAQFRASLWEAAAVEEEAAHTLPRLHCVPEARIIQRKQ